MLDFFRRDEVRAAIRLRVMIVAALMALPTYLALGARLWWFLELATHFRVHYLAGLCLAIIPIIRWRRWKVAVWVGIALVINLWLVLPLYFADHKSSPEPSIRLLQANVLTKTSSTIVF